MDHRKSYVPGLASNLYFYHINFSAGKIFVNVKKQVIISYHEGTPPDEGGGGGRGRIPRKLKELNRVLDAQTFLDVG